jgi:hypothetical protein
MNGPSSAIVSSALVDKVSWWVAPGQPQALLAWEAHVLTTLPGPRRFVAGDLSGSQYGHDEMFQLPSAQPALRDQELIVEVADAGGGRTWIRVDAEVAWQPDRPASTLVPAAARVVTISEVAVITQHPPLPRPVTITDEGVVRRIAGLANGLELSTVGAAPCAPPLSVQLRLAFRARPAGPALATVETTGSCGTVANSVNGQDKPALQVTPAFIPGVLRAASLPWTGVG